MQDDIAKLMNSVRIGRKKRRPPRSKVPPKGAQKDADAPKERAPVPIDPELIKDMKKLQEAANESLPAFKDALKDYAAEQQAKNERLAQMIVDAHDLGFKDGLANRQGDHKPMSAIMPISRRQCAAARTLLEWSQTQLAEFAGVGLSCISGFENGKQEPRGEQRDRLRISLELAGIEFTHGHSTNGSGSGVRWRSSDDEHDHNLAKRAESHPDDMPALGELYHFVFGEITSDG